ncbi:hypothetical protein BD770DRAFT_326843, partial [Pilaira anomala]
QQGTPSKLRCVFCKVEKPLEAFSTKQIQKATFNPYVLASYHKKAKVTFCMKCTQPQRTHLTCMICSKKQTLDKFAKKQRRNSENAICLKCNKKHAEEDVWATDPETDSEED